MKKLFTVCLFVAAMSALVGCGGDEPGGRGNGEQPVTNPEFTEAEMVYGWDEYNSQTGWYYIALYNDSEDIYFEFSSDYYEDGMKAYPASGTYTFADTYDKFTFNSESGFYRMAGPGKERGEYYAVTGGSFSLTRNGNEYSIAYDVTLANGSRFKGTYNGIPFRTASKENITLDLNDNGDSMVVAYELSDEGEAMSEYERIWQIYIEQDGDYDDELYLYVNTEKGLTQLPTGNFPMATAARQGIAGTAEPSSIYEKDEDFLMEPLGCFYRAWFRNDDSEYSGGYGLPYFSVPGKGFVNIGKEGEDYTLEFSYEMFNGKTVSGTYTGYIYHPGEDDWRMRSGVRSAETQHTESRFAPRFSAKRR